MDHYFPHGPFPFSVNLLISPTFLYMSPPSLLLRSYHASVSLSSEKSWVLFISINLFTHLSWDLSLFFHD